jgi:hypothetical protein
MWMVGQQPSTAALYYGIPIGAEIFKKIIG